MTAIIIDDEIYCADVLKILLLRHCPDVQIIAIFTQATEAVEFLKENRPDIIFLDIEMPQMNGFELLQQVGQLSSTVIFTTAYDQYAIKAFKFNAVDYLLKPIDKDELKSAVTKATPPLSHEILTYMQDLKKNAVPEKILLHIGHEIIFVQVKSIICCEAVGSYCKIYCTGKEYPYMLSKTLRDVEDQLNNTAFFRPHTSWLVHESYIHKIIRSDSMEIVMTNHIHIPISRNKKQEIITRLIRK